MNKIALGFAFAGLLSLGACGGGGGSGSSSTPPVTNPQQPTQDNTQVLGVYTPQAQNATYPLTMMVTPDGTLVAQDQNCSFFSGKLVESGTQFTVSGTEYSATTCNGKSNSHPFPGGVLSTSFTMSGSVDNAGVVTLKYSSIDANGTMTMVKDPVSTRTETLAVIENASYTDQIFNTLTIDGSGNITGQTAGGAAITGTVTGPVSSTVNEFPVKLTIGSSQPVSGYLEVVDAGSSSNNELDIIAGNATNDVVAQAFLKK
jgi:hypothetical protein